MLQRRCSLALASLALATVAVPALADDWPPLPDGTGDIVGMAWDPRHSRLWIAADEADDGTLVGIDRDGTTRTMQLGKDVESVQALAIHDGRLYVADIGDADGRRERIVVHRYDGVGNKADHDARWRLRYPDGESHDAAALMVSAKGNLYIVTRGDNPGIYRAPATPGDGTTRLKRVADAPEGVTDGVFLDGGRRIALRTGKGIDVIDAFSFETLASQAYTSQMGEESITTDRDQLILGRDAIRAQDVPSGNSTVDPSPSAPPSSPAASSEPEPTQGGAASPTPSDAPSASSQAQAPQDKVPAPRNTGTMIALALAGLVALIAGAVTYFVK